MLNTKNCGCVKCYTVIISGCEKRLVPSTVNTGLIGHQTRTAYIFFDTGNCGCMELQSVCLRVFVQRAQLFGRQETVSIHPVLPCGALLPVEATAMFEVNRHFYGWKTVDILPMYQAIREELHNAPFGMSLSIASPSFIAFSAEPSTRPRLLMGWRDVPCVEGITADCPCSGALDICAPMTCEYCRRGGSEVRVESQVWDIEFEHEDSSVMRRVDRMKQGTFFVSNMGEQELLAVIETGFDRDRWAHDTQKSIAPGETQAIVARFFGRYYRLALATPGTGKAVVEFIGQYY